LFVKTTIMEPMVLIIGGGVVLLAILATLFYAKANTGKQLTVLARTVKAKRNAVARATKFSCPIANRERTVVGQGFLKRKHS
jgi:hypothetical protein